MRGLLLAWMSMVSCGPEGFVEICEDMRDNDGDGFFDEGCPDSDPREQCSNWVDDDGDGAVDCDDADCFTVSVCITEACGDGFDNDLDGLIDCDDPDCETLLECTGGARWYLGGEATVDVEAPRYDGVRVLEVEVADNDGGLYNVGDLLCSTSWVHEGNRSAGVCEGCEWYVMLNVGMEQGSQGPECSYWQNFTNPDSNIYYGPGGFPDGLGYNPAYGTGEGLVFPALMFAYGGFYSTPRWYALPSRTEFEWNAATGAFNWSLLWGYDYYR